MRKDLKHWNEALKLAETHDPDRCAPGRAREDRDAKELEAGKVQFLPTHMLHR